MNQTKQEAAEAYCALIRTAEVKPEGKVRRESFIAGADWAELKWIPVTERLPENGGEPVIIIYKNPFFGLLESCFGSAEYHSDRKKWISPLTGGRMIEIEVYNVTHWCPIPDSLLNFKP